MNLEKIKVKDNYREDDGYIICKQGNKVLVYLPPKLYGEVPCISFAHKNYEDQYILDEGKFINIEDNEISINLLEVVQELIKEK